VAYCVHCGEELLPGAGYCRGCGAPTGRPTTLPRSAYGAFWRRLLASLIDLLVVGIPFWLIVLALVLHGDRFGYHYDANPPPGQSPITGGPSDPVLAALEITFAIPTWLYDALLISSRRQATVGQMALGMRVTDLEGGRISFGRATGRHFTSILSGAILGIGYLMIIWTERKQALHDIIAGTLVLRGPPDNVTGGDRGGW
jgi:uncharacterized RDD family membrane protein YckC